MDSNSAVGDRTDVAAVHRIEFDVDWPPGFASVFVLDGAEPVLVDAGMPGAENEQVFRAALADIGLTPGEIAHVVITHPHVDHLGLVDTLREAGDPVVYAPRSYRKRLHRPIEAVRESTVATVREVGVPDEMVEYAVDAALDRRRTIRELLEPEWVDEWIDDGQRFSAGDRAFTALATPGHHRDHLCFRVDLGSERALFSGDMALSTFRTPVLHAYFQPEQRVGVRAYHEALDALADRRVDRVYPGHGPVHDDLEAAIETARSSLDRLCDRTETTLRESGTHAVHVASERVDDVSSGPWIPEAVAALAQLEREGRAESRLEDGVRLYTPAHS